MVDVPIFHWAYWNILIKFANNVHILYIAGVNQVVDVDVCTIYFVYM
jgi:hypothetical protein